jgi:hypothetical protein
MLIEIVLFICLSLHQQFLSYLAAVTITGDKAALITHCF